MSSTPVSPNSTVFQRDVEDRDMLESLKGLSIKGFHDSHEAGVNTPSSTNASLPTPPALRTSRVYLASAERPFSGTDWYPQIPPNAPLMKDLDSFTDGTGHGSFDFPAAHGTDDAVWPLIFHPADDFDHSDEVETPSTATMLSLALDQLPSPSHPHDFVRAWIEEVSATTPTPDPTVDEPLPKKRRRSLTQDGETEERRLRAWSPVVETTAPPEPSPQSDEYPFDWPVSENPG